MKIYPLILSAFILISSCKKTSSDPDDTNNSGNNNGSVSTIEEVEHKEKWQIDYNLKINQQVGTHKNTVSRLSLADQEYHYKVWSSGYQTLGYVCSFDGNDWSDCQTVGYNASLANTNTLIASIWVDWVSKTKKSTIETYLFDSKSKKWVLYDQDISDEPASSWKITASGNNLYLVTQQNTYDPIDIWKWNNQTKKWDLIADDLTITNNWRSFSISPGLENEFIIKAYITGEDYKISYYLFKNGKIELLYKTANYNIVASSAISYVFPFNNKYLLVDGNIGYITAINEIEPLHKELSGGNIFAQVVGNKLFFMNGSRPLYTYSINELKVYDSDTKKLHQLNLEVNTDQIYDRILGQQLPSSWSFKVKGNIIELIANTSHGVSGSSIVSDVALLTYNINW